MDNISSYAEILDYQKLYQFIELGVPGTLMMCSEWWAYEVVTVFAGFLGPAELGCMSIILQTCALLYMMFSLSNNKSEDSAGNDEQKEQENTLVLVRAKLDDNAILKERLATPEKFLFNNAVWDLLEKISEEGNADDNYAETVSVAEGSKKMILSCMDPEAKLFLPIEPEVFAQLESTWAAEIRASQ